MGARRTVLHWRRRRGLQRTRPHGGRLDRGDAGGIDAFHRRRAADACRGRYPLPGTGTVARIPKRVMSKPIITFVAALALAGSASSLAFDKSTQLGPNPSLPEPEHSLLPQMNVPKVTAWSNGE